MKRLGFASLSALICLASALPVMAQATAAATEACNTKVRASMAAPDDMKLFNDFINDPTCKDSMYRETVFNTTFQKFIGAMKWKDVYDLANRYEKEVNPKTDQLKKFFAQYGLTAASQLGDLDKVLEMGEKVLVIDSTDLNAMVILIGALPEKYSALTDPAAAKDKDKYLARAEELAKKLVAMKKPDGLTDQVWQQSVVGVAHAVLGFVALQRMDYPGASGEYEQAIKINNKDQMSWYRGGLAKIYIATAAQKPLAGLYADANDKRNTPGPEYDAAVEKRDAAVKEFTEKRDASWASLASAASMGGPIGDAAKKQLETLWKQAHDDKTDGMDEYIAMHKIQ